MHPNLQNLQKYRWPALAWLLLVALYSIIAVHVADWPVFSSPDETANFAFATQFTEDSQLGIATPLPSGGPRSVVNQGHTLVPTSFAFFPAFLGTVGSIAGNLGMLLLGPILAASAVLCLWAMAKIILQHRISALWVGVLFATTPTYWFYASRSFWQNGIFVSLLVIAVWLGMQAAKRRWWLVAALSGLVAGVAVAIRPSELVWLVPAVLAGVLLLWRSIWWRYLVVGCVAALLPILSLLSLQKVTYGDPLATGYRQESILEPTQASPGQSQFRQWKNVLFPFGTSLSTAIDRVAANGVPPLSYLVIPGLVGLLYLLAWPRTPRGIRRMFLSAVVGAVVLIVLYGNYRFVEFPVSRVPTLGSSYLRYWLPFVPLLGLGVGALLNVLFRRGAIAKRLGWILGAGIFLINLTLICTADIGLADTLPRFTQWQEHSQWVVQQTSADAVVVAGSSDKLIFPRRQVIGYDGTLPPITFSFSSLAKVAPTYLLLPAATDLEQLQGRYPDVQIGEAKTGPQGIFLVRWETVPEI